MTVGGPAQLPAWLSCDSGATRRALCAWREVKYSGGLGSDFLLATSRLSFRSEFPGALVLRRLILYRNAADLSWIIDRSTIRCWIEKGATNQLKRIYFQPTASSGQDTVDAGAVGATCRVSCRGACVKTAWSLEIDQANVLSSTSSN